MAVRCVLTTIDNPCNPFTNFDDWYTFDRDHCYFTCEWEAIYSKASPKMTDAMYIEETSFAIDRFLKLNPYGLHVKLYENEAETLIPLYNEVYKQLKKDGYFN